MVHIRCKRNGGRTAWLRCPPHSRSVLFTRELSVFVNFTHTFQKKYPKAMSLPTPTDLTGCTVSISGLKQRADLNGSTALVVGSAGEGTGRWVCEVGGDECVRLRLANITVTELPEEESDEEMEEEEMEEDMEESEEEGPASASVSLHYGKVEAKKGRLGINFAADNDLTVCGVTEGTPAAEAKLAEYDGWQLTQVNTTAVHNITEAGYAISAAKAKPSPNLTLTFAKALPRYVSLEDMLANTAAPSTPIDPKKVSFKIPACAPLNPSLSIEICLKTKGNEMSVFYKVAGKARPAITSAVFELIGEHYTRELRFPSLGTCMWLPKEDFAVNYSLLTAMFEKAGVTMRGFNSRFKEETLMQVAEIEQQEEEERQKKLAKKELKGVNVKKRRLMQKGGPSKKQKKA